MKVFLLTTKLFGRGPEDAECVEEEEAMVVPITEANLHNITEVMLRHKKTLNKKSAKDVVRLVTRSQGAQMWNVSGAR